MRKETGFDLAGNRPGAELRTLRVEWARIVDERDAVGAAIDERVVRFNAITLGTPFQCGVNLVGAVDR